MSSPRQIARSFFYTLGSGYVARLASVGLTLLIRRVLGPEVFDEMITPMVIFVLLSSLSQFGLLQALLHYQDRADEFVDTHFTLNLLVSTAVLSVTCAVGLGLRWVWPETYGWTGVVLCIFGGLRFLKNLTTTSEALLRRDFEFGRLSLLHGFGTVLALGAALAAGVAGWGRWSLILGGWTTYAIFSVVYVGIFVVGVWWSRPIRLRLAWDPEWVRRLTGYGVWLWLGWVLQNFVWYYDKLVLRAVVGVRELTYYESAWWLMQLPTAVISHIILSYTLALYARYQGQRERLGELFTTMVSIVVRCSAPVALVLALTATDVVALMGQDWAPAATIVVWLAIFGFVRPLLDEGYGLLWAAGDTRAGAVVMGMQAALAAVLVPVVAHADGVRGVALTMGAITGLGAVAVAIRVRRHIDVGWRQIFAAPLVALAVAGAVGVRSRGILVGSETEGILALTLRGGLIAAVYALVLLLLERRRMVQLASQAWRVVRERPTSPEPDGSAQPLP